MTADRRGQNDVSAELVRGQPVSSAQADAPSRQGQACPDHSADRCDAEIAVDVETGLRWTHAVAQGAVTVVVDAGWVTMSGQVASPMEKQAAADSVRYLRGVVGLTDDIAVAPRCAAAWDPVTGTSPPSTTNHTVDGATRKENAMNSIALFADRIDHAVLNDGTPVFIRAIHREDVELERRFIEALSPVSRRFRFLESMREPSAALLKQMTVIDPMTDAAFVALLGTGDRATQIGVGRFSAQPDGQDCEFAVTVGDAWQHKGLGTLLMQRLIEVAKARGIKTMHSSDAADNTRMRQFAEHLNFEHRRDPDDATLVRYSVDVGTSELVDD